MRSRLVDAVAVCGEFPLRQGILSYGAMLKVRPSPYAAIYHLSDGRKRYRVLGELGKPFILRKFRRLLDAERPDVLVSVHPLLNVLARQTMDSLKISAPLITVITDLVTIHHSWTAGAAADHYMVASREAYDVCVDRDIPPARIHEFGLPIRAGFGPPAGDRVRLKTSLGLDPRRRTLLVMAGAEGAGKIPRLLPEIAPDLRSLDVQLVVITGRNPMLRRRLLKSAKSLAAVTHVLGFVENVADYMRASDALLTKAGPGTIAEAAACGLPIIVCDYISGQEAGNLDYVQRRGSGIVAMDSAAVQIALQRIFTDGGDEAKKLRDAALAVARPHAAGDVAQFLLDLMAAA